MPTQAMLHIIVIDDKDGTNFHSFFTPEERDARFLEFCQARWDEDEGECPSDPYEAYEQISGHAGGDYAYIEDIDITNHPLIAPLIALLTEVVTSETDSEGDVILPLDRVNDVRVRIHQALGLPILRKDVFHGHRVERDSDDEPIVWRNKYLCDCGEEWDDEWSCQCDDRCPSCDTSISPLESEWIGPEGDEATALFFETVDSFTAARAETPETTINTEPPEKEEAA